MVAHSRTPLGARALRALNVPAPIAVELDAAGVPKRVRRERWPVSRPVAAVADSWRIDDEWWRKREISRLYYLLVLDDGASLTVFYDRIANAWYEQRG